jgi:hypothetical protein
MGNFTFEVSRLKPCRSTWTWRGVLSQTGRAGATALFYAETTRTPRGVDAVEISRRGVETLRKTEKGKFGPR